VNQHTVVAIQRHEIRNGTERHEIEQIGDRRCVATESAILHGARQRRHQIKRDADTGERLARKCISRRIGIHDGVRGGNRCRRQVMIGDQRLDAE
jgi:hypothetical protein